MSKYGNVWEIFLVEILSIQIKKTGRLVDYFPGNNFYGYCVKKLEKEKKTSNLIYYVIIGDKVFYVSRETLFSTI